MNYISNNEYPKLTQIKTAKEYSLHVYGSYAFKTACKYDFLPPRFPLLMLITQYQPQSARLLNSGTMYIIVVMA